MTRYIKLDEWEKCFDKMMTGCPLPKKTIAKIKQMWVDEMPTANVVEVTDKSMESLVKGLEILGDTNNMAIEALQAQTDGDLISRADAIKAIEYRRKTANIDNRIILDEVEDRIRELPSANRPSGEWKQITPARIYDCSNCGHYVLTDDIEEYNYCPSCGAKMGGNK